MSFLISFLISGFVLAFIFVFLFKFFAWRMVKSKLSFLQAYLITAVLLCLTGVATYAFSVGKADQATFVMVLVGMAHDIRHTISSPWDIIMMCVTILIGALICSRLLKTSEGKSIGFARGLLVYISFRISIILSLLILAGVILISDQIFRHKQESFIIKP
jgi:phosphate/sulfate permease